MSLLPEYVVFKLVGSDPLRVLCVVDDIGSLMYVEGSVLSPEARFHVLRAPDGKVHIRSCFNNRFWSRQVGNQIRATARNPVTTETLPVQTMFRPVYEANNTVRFEHPRGGPVLMVTPDKLWRYRLVVLLPGTVPALSTMVDEQTLVRFPRRVAFKGHNDRFLANRQRSNKFEEETYEPYGTQYSISQTVDGDVRVRSLEAERYWSVGDGNWVKSEDNGFKPYNLETLFRAFIDERNSDEDEDEDEDEKNKDKDKIVLRSRSNNMYCVNVENGLRASANSMIPSTRLIVVEPIVWKKVTVHDNAFRMDNIRVYNHRENEFVDIGNITNDSDGEVTEPKTLMKEVTETSSWTNSEGVTRSTSMSFSSGVPTLGLGMEVKFEGHVSDAYEWSKIIETKRTISETITITVPKRTRLRYFLSFSTATIDIPFSYTQTNQYVTGVQETVHNSDGIFTARNVYYVYVKTEETPL